MLCDRRQPLYADVHRIFAPVFDTLLTHGDQYRHLADLPSYLDADQRLSMLYTDSDAWVRRVILNVAGSGAFSSDRTIAEYARDIWKVDGAKSFVGSWNELMSVITSRTTVLKGAVSR